MYNSGKVISFLIIMVGLLTVPIWYGLASGTSGAGPELEKAAKGDACVEATGYMKAMHMEMLSTWRDDVVRLAERTYTNAKGQKFEKSLTGTCLDCHDDEEKFCAKCHDFAGVEPYCWDCHNLPGKD